MNDGFKKFIAAPERDRLDVFLAASRRLGAAVQNPPTRPTPRCPPARGISKRSAEISPCASTKRGVSIRFGLTLLIVVDQEYQKWYSTL